MHTGHPKHPLKETPKADVPAYHFVVIIFSKHSPGLADKLQTQHSRWALSLSLSSFTSSLEFRFFPFGPFAATLCQRWQDDGAEENRRRWREENKMAQRREGYDFERAQAGDRCAHTLTCQDTNTHTHRVLRVFLFVPGASLLLKSQTSTWLFITGDTPQLVKVNTWEGKRESPAFGLA